MNGARTWLAAAWAICLKDLRAEFRTRYALSAIALFAVTTLTVVSFALGAFGLEQYLLGGLLWVVIFFAAMAGLSRSFVHEEEAKTAPALRLAAPPGAVYLGKLLFNLALLVMLEVLVVPLFIVMMNLEIAHLGHFLVVLILGGMGLAGVTTVVAAIVTQTGARGALFSVLSFPLLLPLLVACIQGSQAALTGGELADVWPNVQLLFAYCIATVTTSVLVFPAVWTE